MAVVEGLQDGRWALAHKTHHCLVDGVGSVDVAYVLLDTSPDGHRIHAAGNGQGSGTGRPPGSPPDEHPSSVPSRLDRAEEALGFDAAVNLARAGLHGLTHPRGTLAAARAAVELVVREELKGAPHTSLNEPIGSRRRFEVLCVPLDDLKAIKNALGGTVNDAVLAITASGLRALLDGRDEELPPAGLRAMVPMNIRAADQHFALGNRISSLFIDLPVAEPDLLGRHRETVARSRALKDGEQARGSTAMLDAAGLAPPVLHASLARSLYATRLFNLTITNVPGAQQTLYAFGAPMREVHPLVPLAADHAIGVAAVSYDGNVFFGIVADPGRVPDLDVALHAMQTARDELLRVARATARPARPHARLAGAGVRGEHSIAGHGPTARARPR
jgi:WS/DGAT/MGAT family acyltransferase